MDGSVITNQQMREAFEAIIPEFEDRRVMCSLLLKTISYCTELGSSAWSVTLLTSGFRVNIGQVEAMTCFYTGFNAAELESLFLVDQGLLDFRFLVSGQHVAQLIEDYPDRVRPASYRSVREPHWVVHATLHVEGDRNDVQRAKEVKLMHVAQKAHRHFAVAAAHTPTGALRKSSNFARFHCGAIVSCANEIVKAEETRSSAVIPLP